VRVSPFGISPGAFYTAVTHLGPQRISNPTDTGDLLVVAKVQSRPNTYVCLPDNSYVPVLIAFNTAAHQPLLMDQVTDRPDEIPLDLFRARPYDLGDLIQRLTEYAIDHVVEVDQLTRSAVHLWFNAGLIEPATAAASLMQVYTRVCQADDWLQKSLHAVAPEDDRGLRKLAILVIGEAVIRMSTSYQG